MTLFIVGGSNSLFRDGWTGKFPEAKNLSVGATTTLCGIFRCLQPDGPKIGDTVIWEYGVNETVHSRRIYDTDVILRNLEQFLRMANQNKWKVLPLMLIPQVEEREGTPEYYHHALGLFKYYGLSVVDVSANFREKLGQVPADYYTDPLHYRRDEEVAGEIGRMVQKSLCTAACPINVEPVRSNGKLELIELPASSWFENSIMSLPLINMPVALRMDAPGIIRSVIVLCRPGVSAGFRIRLIRQGEALADARVSTSCKAEKTLLKALNADNLGKWAFKAGDRLVLRYIQKGGILYAEQGLRRKLESVSIPDCDTLAGILVERS